MAISLKDLVAQREVLDAKIDEMRSAAKTDAISKARALIEEHSLTQQDVFPSKSGAKTTRKTTTTKVAAKYRGPNGETYSGRGLKPKWLSALVANGHSLDEYLIKK